MSSKSKGGSFEREIAALLSLWWSDSERDDIFYRSQSSGGRFTVRKKVGKDTALQGGDITCSDPSGEPLIKKWSIEIKTGYGTKKQIKDKDGEKVKDEMIRWDILDIIDSKQRETILEKMWQQSYRDAVLTDRTPILIFRRNGRSPCIMFDDHLKQELENYFGKVCNKCSIILDWFDTYTIMPLQDFFEWIPDPRSVLCSKPSLLKTSKLIKKLT